MTKNTAAGYECVYEIRYKFTNDVYDVYKSYFAR